LRNLVFEISGAVSPFFFAVRRKETDMKHGFLKGNKVAECQDGQAQLMARFLRDGVVDEWRDGETPPAPEPAAGAETEAAGVAPEAAGTQETPAPHQPEAQETQTGTQAADGASKPGDGDALPGLETARAENTEAKPNGKTKPGKRVG
jgi:hypothetical protein